MDWNLTVEKNRDALKRILAMLVAMVGTRRSRTHSELLGCLRRKAGAARRDRLSRIRPGRASEFRKQLPHEAHQALNELQCLAVTGERPDTP
jgi:hypothetical protein